MGAPCPSTSAGPLRRLGFAHRAHGRLDRAAVRMAVNPDGENGRWKERPFRVRSGRALKRPRTYWESRPMDQATIDPTSVQTAAQKTMRASVKPPADGRQEDRAEESTQGRDGQDDPPAGRLD